MLTLGASKKDGGGSEVRFAPYIQRHPKKLSLVPRPVHAIRVTRGGLQPSAIARWWDFSRQAWQVTSHLKSPRTTGKEAAKNSGFEINLLSGVLTLGRTSKFIPPPWYKGGGELGVDGIPSRSFWYVAVLWNDFTFSGKPLIFLTRWGIFYCDFSNHGRHLGRHLGFYQELEIRLKPREMQIISGTEYRR